MLNEQYLANFVIKIMSSYTPSELNWIRAILVVTGITNILYAFLIIFFQPLMYNLLQLDEAYNGYLLKSLAIMSIAMGIGYIIASRNVSKYWPIVLMGLFVKIFMPLNLFAAYRAMEIEMASFRLASSYHIIWIIPFVAILYRVYLQAYLEDEEIIEMASDDISTSLELYTTNRARSVYEASVESPILLVFLRHFGCTFCREALNYLSSNRNEIESNGTKIVLVHMVSEIEATEALKHYNLEGIEHVSDEESLLYKGFNLKRGTFSQLFGLKVWLRGFYVGFIKKQGIGAIQGDQYQMPGVFLIEDGKVSKQFIHSNASEIPPYLELATI